MTNNYTVGGNADSWCSKCKLELGHTIVAMVDGLPKKVKCNTCGGQHNFRAKPAEKNKPKLKTSARKPKTMALDYDGYIANLTEADLSAATKYSMKGNFKKDEAIDHPAFGIGIVLNVIQTNKVEILFKDGAKLLIQNR